ncbi:DNA translocase FtsK [Priestia taiwanensis]|uniref:FtsK domain-containing protein n=1 Tax=Priestia taiwanensis TaxID=1347902 RepID=A0A917AUT8_9BACI|nr:DNA translocase FtsK [Priestia taiwanensis]MBM7363401.1 S-DNA-T family DNA segregation ATPase FtsK/SpoIIIE [Priestia taiwanensis]GGE77456.1 hypothetical protein GCM10007140_28900 [Priestia taiwanensis]
MKWFKKLFEKEDEYIEEIERVIPAMQEEQRESDSDVGYLYPQGKFRFPVIPDSPVTTKQPTYEEKRERVPLSQSQTHHDEQEPLPTPVVKKKEPIRRMQPKEPVQQENVKKRPFRPSEIPSPIYGFNRPAQPSTVQEKEEQRELVTPSVHEHEYRPLGQRDPAVPPKKEIHQERVAPPMRKDCSPVQNEQVVHSEMEANQEQVMPFTSEPEVLQIQQREQILSEEREEYPELVTQAIDEPSHSSKEDESVGLENEEDSCTYDIEVIDESMEVREANVPTKEENVTEEIQVSYSELADDEDEREWDSPHVSERVIELIEEEEDTEEIMVTEPLRPLVSNQLQQPPSRENMQREEQTQVEQSVQREQEQPRKRVVPYNVMMRKEDRERNVQRPVETKPKPTYEFPSLSLLNIPPHSQGNDEEWIKEQAELLHTALQNFNVGAKVVHYTQGPAVTRFEVQPDPGVKVNKITNLTDDIKLNLAAKDIRIEAPIPGKNTVGIEVPNRTSKPVMLREILRTPAFTKDESPVPVALGLDISGKPIVTDVKKMPHGLIAGATGSGKSVCINAILLSILYKAQPHEVKLMLIDPKMVELAPYNNIPHLVSPVITDVKAATAALKWAVEEMERRYEMFAHAGVRDLTRFNELAKKHGGQGEPLPYLVIVIDELADLMMVAPGDVEESICRIAQKARACGIHLLLATQRPSVDVITGLIKANIPTRLAFTVSSQIDSRTIIDTNGADKLLGRGDMLFLENGSSKPVRVQGVYVSDEEIERVVSHVKKQMGPNYLFKQEDLVLKATTSDVDDDLFYEACEFVIEQGGASASSLQRKFRIGYNRAARLVDMMEAQGIISEARGSKPREVLITEDELTDMNV